MLLANIISADYPLLLALSGPSSLFNFLAAYLQPQLVVRCGISSYLERMFMWLYGVIYDIKKLLGIRHILREREISPVGAFWI